MTKRILTHDDVTGACELSSLAKYPTIAAGSNMTITPATNTATGEVTYTLSADVVGARSGNTPPVAAPTVSQSDFYIDTSTSPDTLYWHNGVTWNMLGDGNITGATYNNVTNELTLTRSLGGNIVVSMADCDCPPATAAAAPTAAPAAGASPYFVNTSTAPHSLYYWNGTVWNLLGDGVGDAASIVTESPITGNGTVATPYGVQAAQDDQQGVIELATTAEVAQGLDKVRAVTPWTLRLVLDAIRPCTATFATAAQIAAINRSTDRITACLNGNIVSMPLSALDVPFDACALTASTTAENTALNRTGDTVVTCIGGVTRKVPIETIAPTPVIPAPFAACSVQLASAAEIAAIDRANDSVIACIGGQQRRVHMTDLVAATAAASASGSFIIGGATQAGYYGPGSGGGLGNIYTAGAGCWYVTVEGYSAGAATVVITSTGNMTETSPSADTFGSNYSGFLTAGQTISVSGSGGQARIVARPINC